MVRSRQAVPGPAPYGEAYPSALCLRRGRRANHQMLAMVASTPRAAAGLAILRERSDMPPTLPGERAVPDPSGGGRTQRAVCGHVVTIVSSEIPICFFGSSYLLHISRLGMTRTLAL